MDDVEKAWLAGLLEGEGSFFSRVREDTRFTPPSIAVYFTASMVTTDRDVAARAACLMGAKLYGPYKQRNTAHTDFYRVALYKRADVLALVTELRPLMSTRRQRQIDKLLDTAAAYPKRRTGPR